MPEVANTTAPAAQPTTDPAWPPTTRRGWSSRSARMTSTSQRAARQQDSARSAAAGRQTAGRAVVGQGVTEGRASNPTAGTRLRGHRPRPRRSVPHVEAPADVGQARVTVTAGVPGKLHPSWYAQPAEAGQLSTGRSSSAAVSAAISSPCATSTTGRSAAGTPVRLAGHELAHQRQAAVGDVDPALPAGAQRASSRHASRAPGAISSTSRWVIPCQSPRCSRSRSSTETCCPHQSPKRHRGVEGAAQIRRHQQRLIAGQRFGGDSFAAQGPTDRCRAGPCMRGCRR